MGRGRKHLISQVPLEGRKEFTMNTMQRAHAYAWTHREEYPSYKEALSEGLKLAHAEARRSKEKLQVKVELPEHSADPEAYAARLMTEGVQKYRERVPLLLRDWKADDYDGRKDFRRGAGWW